MVLKKKNLSLFCVLYNTAKLYNSTTHGLSLTRSFVKSARVFRGWGEEKRASFEM